MKKRWLYLLMCGVFCVFLLMISPTGVKANEIVEEQDAKVYLDAIMDELDLESMDNFSVENLPEKITFSDMVYQLVSGDEGKVNVHTIGTWILDLFFYEISSAKSLFIQMLILAILFAVINRFFIQKGTYVNEMSFFMIYGSMMILLMQSFVLISDVVTSAVEKVSDFLAILVPAYATTLMLSGNTSSAGAFYELIFGIMCVLEWAMKTLLVPGIHIFVLLMFLDHLFEEEKLTKFAELIESGIKTFLKVAMGGVIGLGVVQSLISPAKDRIAESVVLKSLSAIPGIGNSIHFAEEILLGCGMMVKNSVGVAGLIILAIICIVPIIKVFCFTFLYRLLGAVLQPIADKRIVECLQGVARGSSLYLKIMVNTMLLLIITIAMITAATSFVY